MLSVLTFSTFETMKLEIHEHISRLLYDHECVIIPGFGAFLTRHHVAEVNNATHMLRPMSRRVHFNASINQNDGLLAKSIAYFEQINYSRALELIGSELEKWTKVLNAGQKLNVAGIGRLYRDSNTSLQFSPSLEINYLPSAYGLGIFRTDAIQREGAIRKSIASAIEINLKPETEIKELKNLFSGCHGQLC